MVLFPPPKTGVMVELIAVEIATFPRQDVPGGSSGKIRLTGDDCRKIWSIF
jgi:hypothetical protein